MIKISEVSKLTGVSIRTLQYYDKIGLLKATDYTDSGYRLYDDTALEQLQQILLFRELEFPLKDIKRILCSPDYDKSKALDQQIALLEMKQAHIGNLITLARGLKLAGGKYMEFSAFDTRKMDEYIQQAKASWNTTEECSAFVEKNGNRTLSEIRSIGDHLLELVTELGMMKERSLSDSTVIAQVKKIQEYVTEHYYQCTDVHLARLGAMYGAGGESSLQIDAMGGSGSAEFASNAILAYCAHNK